MGKRGTKTFCREKSCGLSNKNESIYICFCWLLPHRQIKYPVDFDDELKIGDVRYDKMT